MATLEGNAVTDVGPTTSATVVEWTSELLVPVIVSVLEPEGVDADVWTTSWAEPEPAIVSGLNVALAPAGRPSAVRATSPPKPATEPTVTVYVTLPPALVLAEAGEAAIVKSCSGSTTSVTGAACESEPLVPWIVSG